ncbi:HNH endonuclease signature motif containing protein [Paenibacillus sp. MMS18-CY102]|uniref:HNH endonuclease signature motif containing protein n=1 Tax=Paenibacillus sp. MMS18-CY102 TaxID=2682849 RepID=UPI00136520BC|nr:HNH endonuclease signature motif containing protein [Paenibacillus sp. MMS18-CY102]MWC26645.1 HNH endonuclease [Paenibacillus sp. MMS18-CY102]
MAKHSILHSFYTSSKWRNLRLNLILERGHRCQRCGDDIFRPIDIIGHHIIELTPENVHDYNISLNPSNIELICYDCHNKEHKRFGYQASKEVYLVYGPPFAGKAELVRQRLHRGDLVVDIDRLYEAVSGLPYYDKPDILFSNVMGVHAVLLDNIRTRYGKWGTAWILGGYADKFKRDRVAEDLGAELVYCELSREECIARLFEDTDRRNRKVEWMGYIDKWFEQYRP